MSNSGVQGKSQVDRLTQLEVSSAETRSELAGLRENVLQVNRSLGQIFERLDRGRSIPWPAVAIFVSVIAMAGGLANAYFGRGIQDAQDMGKTAHDRMATLQAEQERLREALTETRIKVEVEKARHQAITGSDEIKNPRNSQ